MTKLLAMGTSGLLGIGLSALLQGAPPQDGPPPPPHEAKKKGGPGPKDEMKPAYDLLRKLRSEDGPAGKPEARLKDLTDRATQLYRKAIDAGEGREAHEYAIAAHDLARAVDHARNAARLDRADPELPPPPHRGGPEGVRERTRRDLRHAFDRIREAREADYGPEAKLYLDTARDLYTAARRDAQDDRDERAGELARAAEAITHVPEHLARASGRDVPPPEAGREKPDPKKEKARSKKEKGERPEPKKEKGEPRDADGIPPAIDD